MRSPDIRVARILLPQTREQRDASGLALLGIKAILAQKPENRPEDPKKSPAPSSTPPPKQHEKPSGEPMAGSSRPSRKPPIS